MGPWLCSHGNRVSYGATLGWWERLQWGRGCVATEIWRICGRPGERLVASMGPWLCSHGNGGLFAFPLPRFRGFNGAVAV